MAHLFRLARDRLGENDNACRKLRHAPAEGDAIPAPGYLVNEQLHEGSDKRANRSNVASSLEAYRKSRPLFTDNEKTLQGRIPNPNVSGGAKPR